jgi:benzylsuccinate CoA-transferase BbsF subunit
MAPHGSYPCLGEDAWCALAVETDDHWQRLAAVIAEDWAFEPGLATAEGRLAQGDRLDALISGWTQDRTASEVEQLLREARVPVSRVVTGDDLAMDESAHGDGLFSCVAHPTAGARWYTGLPVTGPAGERIPLRRAPLLGEHDGYVLFELLGLSAGEASALVNSGAIGY